jgi:tumor protein p53-inducible protein 3
LMGGSRKEINLRDIMAKRLRIMGSTLRNRSDEHKAGLIANFSRWALPHFEEGILRPNVWKIMPLEEVAQAHMLMQENANAGKIVLKV